jgi:hypothetical protein
MFGNTMRTLHEKYLSDHIVQIAAFLVMSICGNSSFESQADADDFDAMAKRVTQVTDWKTDIATFLDDHCVACHEGADAEGDLDLTALDDNLTDAETMRRWVLIHDRIASGEMPPRDQAVVPVQAKATTLSRLSAQLTRADRLQHDVVLRRLNRTEYENSVRDLFGVFVLAKDYLPADTPTAGFDNVGEGLAISAEAMQAYLKAADAVLDAALGPPKAPTYIQFKTNLNDQRDHRGKLSDRQFGKMFRKTDDGLVIFQSNYCPTHLVNFARLRAPAGTYRGTIRVRAVQSERPVTMRIYGGDTIVGRAENHLVGYYDIPPDQWITVEFEDRLVLDGGTFHPKCFGTIDTRKDADHYPNPGLEIGEITIEGPLEAWPPASRKRLLGNVDPKRGASNDAKRILDKLLPRVFRKPTHPDEVASYVELVKLSMESGLSFEDALRLSIQTALCSPEFLFLSEEGATRISEFALASRLSYLFWSSTPDEELLSLAAKGELRNPNTLRKQTERLLADPKGKAFTENFTGQWLDLREIDFTAPDMDLYPEFDELLKISMVEETQRFFREILNEDLSLMNFVDSDFVIVNERLAAHYGITGVTGQEFRKVQLPSESVRGGVLTQGSILKVTANGTNTSPVLRGAWVMENILGITPEPPPSNVSAVEPDTRGATTLREQLARHRDQVSCAICHDKIDPPGFALECFDAIGGWQDHYRTMGDGKRPGIRRAPFTFRHIRYKIGLPVDASGKTADGIPFQEIREFKRLMLRRKQEIATGLTRKLLTYALGRRISFSDRPAVEKIVSKSGESGYGFRSLVHEIVQSDLFQQP